MRLLKFGDKIIIGLITVLSLVPLLFLPSNPKYVSVSVNGEIVYHEPVSKNAELSLLDSRVLVSIKGGKARITHSDCNDKLCIEMGHATSMRPVVCLPNRVVVSLSKDKEVDTVLG